MLVQESLFVVGPPGVVGAAAGPSATRVGSLSELAAELRLVRSGFQVARPSVDDDGVDLIVSYGIRVQVKGCSSSRGRPQWGFSKKVLVGGRRCHVRGGVTADVLLLHDQVSDSWWVVPACARELSEGASTVLVGDRLERWRERWDVFEAFVVRPPLFVMDGVDA